MPEELNAIPRDFVDSELIKSVSFCLEEPLGLVDALFGHDDV